MIFNPDWILKSCRSDRPSFQKGVKNIPSYKFLPLMYQLAARMGTKKTAAATSEDSGFQDVLSDVRPLPLQHTSPLPP